VIIVFVAASVVHFPLVGSADHAGTSPMSATLRGPGAATTGALDALAATDAVSAVVVEALDAVPVVEDLEGHPMAAAAQERMSNRRIGGRG
jgi:hypothetical protein